MVPPSGGFSERQIMNFKALRETMTEQALSVEYVMRGHANVTIRQLAESCQLREPELSFMLEQMRQNRIVESTDTGFSLTKEYKNSHA
jgi:predicted transcriptional regulator